MKTHIPLHPWLFLAKRYEVVMQILSEPDPKQEGNQMFVAAWRDSNSDAMRGQYFFADLEAQIRLWKERNYNVSIVPLS